MNPSDEEDFTYAAGLRATKLDLPRLTELLSRAETNRAVRLRALSTTTKQLRALEEILTYTRELESYCGSEEHVSRLAFLLRRAHGDFATAIDALLSGFHKTVLDSMRDVMEIEFLLRDFALNHSHIAEWLTASEKVRRAKFQAGSLRQRYATSRGQAPPDMPEATDYRGHSMLVHVLPYDNPIVLRCARRCQRRGRHAGVSLRHPRACASAILCGQWSLSQLSSGVSALREVSQDGAGALGRVPKALGSSCSTTRWTTARCHRCGRLTTGLSGPARRRPLSLRVRHTRG
jgi:hypothetical protein